GGLLLLLVPRRDRDIRIFSLIVSLLTFGLSLHFVARVHRMLPGFQYEIDRAWVSTPNIPYHMGVDGISMWFVFLTTFSSSVFMLAAVIWLYAHVGSFDFVTIQNAIRTGQVEGFSTAAPWLFIGFFLAFAVKVPLFPFHTWLPDAHVEAPTAGSVLLAGVLLKMGTYGLLRFNLVLF